MADAGLQYGTGLQYAMWYAHNAPCLSISVLRNLRGTAVVLMGLCGIAVVLMGLCGTAVVLMGRHAPGCHAAACSVERGGGGWQGNMYTCEHEGGGGARGLQIVGRPGSRAEG